MDKTMAKIVWNILRYATVGFGFAWFISVSSMIEEMMVGKTYMIILIVSTIWIIAFFLFVRHLNKE